MDFSRSPLNYYRRDVEHVAAARRFTALSLFSGGGGADIGIKLAGGHVCAAIDFSPWADRTYRANDPGGMFINADVRQFSRDTDATVGLLRSIGHRPGTIDHAHMSPPCQLFSRGGRGIGESGRSSHHSGVTQMHAATLPFEAAAFVQSARPKTGTMENVTGLVSRYPDLFDRILNAFRFNDGIRTYYCHWRIVRADQFGVAQTRPRVFLIFVRRDVAERVGIWSDRAVLTLFPRPTHPIPVSIRAALSGLLQSDADELPYYRSIRRSRLPFLLRQLPQCPPKPRRLKNVDSYFTLVRCSWDHPAPTLVIAGYVAANGRWKGELITHQHTETPGKSPLFGGHEVGCGFTGTYTNGTAQVHGTALVGKASIAFRATLRLLVPFSSGSI